MLPVLTSLAFAADERSMLEDAMLLCLMPMSKQHGGPVELLDYYNGELDSHDGRQAFAERLLGASPAILLFAGEARFGPTDMRRRRYKHDISLHVLVASTHLRSPEARTRGDVASQFDPTADPGIYRLLRMVKDQLVGRDLGVAGAEPLQAVQEDVVVQDPDLSLWRLILRCTYAETRPDPAKLVAAAVPVGVIAVHHDAVDQDGDTVTLDDVVVTETTT